ncbi:tetratricopeptide repeat-containing sensor histidine kinase [Pedobacter sp. ASV12]|uniref:tetratricopeptide repeat-containing sensor histidine kinase n=1 Tax=Pedobacter sp. ASV12 TaxID=2795120 RepID=UPI0018EAD54F
MYCYSSFKFFKQFWWALVLAGLFFAVSCRKAVEPAQNHDAKVDSAFDVVNGLLNSGEINRSILYVDSVYGTFSNPSPIDLWKKYSFLSNFYLYYDEAPFKAEKYVDSMFAMLKSKGTQYHTEYALTLFAKGDVLRAQHRYDKAFESYYQGHSFAKENLDSCQVASFSAKLGLVRFVQQHYLKAVPYFKQTLKEMASCTDRSTFENQFITPQSTYNSIALCFERANQPDSALRYYLRGLAFIRRTEPRYPAKKDYIETAKGVFYGNLGGLYIRMKDYANAEKYLNMSIAINDRPGYAIGDAQTAKAKLADLYLRTSRVVAAKDAIAELENNLAARQGENDANLNLRNWLYQLKSRYFEIVGDTNMAYRSMLKYNALKDSLQAVNSELKSADLDVVFKQAEQQHLLALVKRDQHLKTVYLVASAIISVMVIVILLMVWLSLKRSRINVANLTSLNKRVIEQNEQLQRTLSILEQSQLDNAQLMKLVAHDLRSPIGAIDMLADMLLTKNTLHATEKELVDLMKQSAEDCLNLVAQLLQPAVAVNALKKEPEDLYGMLNYCLAQLKLKAETKSQQLLLHGQPLVVSVNAVQLWRVISNLIGNAIKFSYEHTVIEITLSHTDSEALISVKDYGIGIPDELKESVFDIYSKSTRVGTAGEQTFGLGLAISRQIIEAHNGKIWFDSEVGVGTVFYVALPLDKPELPFPKTEPQTATSK